MSLILCGLPASGKTTIGMLLAKKLRYSFIDTDRLVEEAYLVENGQQLSCRGIVLQQGSSFFKSLEKCQIARLPAISKQVISLGGAALCDEGNAKILKRLGCIIYLKAPFDAVWKRLQLRERPTFLDSNEPEKSFHQLVLERSPLYEKHASVTIETASLNEDGVVKMILRNLHGW